MSKQPKSSIALAATAMDLPFQSLEVEVQAKLQSNVGVLTPNNVSVMEALSYMNAKVIIVFKY